MKTKAVAKIMLTLVLTSMITLTFSIQPVKAVSIIGDIQIRADGSIDPPTAPLQRIGDIYTFTDDIHLDQPWWGIVVWKNFITVDGNGHSLQGPDGWPAPGFAEWGTRGFFLYCNRVIIKKTNVKGFWDGIEIKTGGSTIKTNIIEANTQSGISVEGSFSTISENDITNNKVGVFLYYSSYNRIYHNNFVGNTVYQALTYGGSSANVWDDGYPSGGNYWSDYTGVDLKSGPSQDQPGSDGIGDTPYIIDANNIDRYPLMKPWQPQKLSSTISISVIPTSIKKGESVTVSGAITPPHAASVTLNYTKPDASFLIRYVTSSSDGDYSDTYTPDATSSWSVQASWDGDADHKGAVSSTSTFEVVAQWAVIIGIDDYLMPGANLMYPSLDAWRMYLTLTLQYGFAPERVHFLTDLVGVSTDNIERDDIINEIRWLADNAEENDIAVFYISSHGVDSPYMNEDPELIAAHSSFISDNEFADEISNIRSRNLLVLLDVSWSGGFILDGADWTAGDNDVWSAEDNIITGGGTFTGSAAGAPEGRIVVTACTEMPFDIPDPWRPPFGYNDAQEIGPLPNWYSSYGGVFTNLFNLGLRGGGLFESSDLNGDGRISVEEATMFARVGVGWMDMLAHEKGIHIHQRPQIYDGLAGEFYLGDARITNVAVKINSPANIMVIDQGGFRVGFDPSTGQSVIETLGASYTGPQADPQVVTIPGALPGSYTIQLVGTATGPYTLEISTSSPDGTILSRQTISGSISEGSALTVKAELSNGFLQVVNQPPIADAGTDRTVEGNTHGGALVTLDGTGSSDPDGDPLTYSWSGDFGTATGATPTVSLTLSDHTITLVVNDGKTNSEPDTVTITVVDTTPPTVTIVNPPPDAALQDRVTFAIHAQDAVSDIASATLSIRDSAGNPIGFEDMAATFDTASGNWTLRFNTLQLPDGFYTATAKATDTSGNVGTSPIVHYSIRNWAMIELLPASETNKAGRTMPVKFALRVKPSVDPSQPFVYNEELTIKISGPSGVLQVSTFGTGAKDYRINILSKLYITNFQTLKTPQTYTVEIYRKEMSIGTFGFNTVK